MKRFFLLCLCLAPVLGGCGGRTYYKSPNATPAQEEKDFRECDFESSKATGNLPDKDDRNDRVKELVDKCMRARGYAPN